MNLSSPSLPASPTPVVLIVEDEWLVRQEIADEFRRAGWTVLETSTGEGALGLLDQGEPIDALITDIQLAGRLDGWEVAQAFRDRYAYLPIVYTSGNAVQEARLVQGSRFMAKPCLADDLMNVCRKFARQAAH